MISYSLVSSAVACTVVDWEFAFDNNKTQWWRRVNSEHVIIMIDDFNS